MRIRHDGQAGLFALRVAFGTLFFLHGWVKLFGNDISFVQEMLGMAGWQIPASLLLLLAVFESIAGLALLAGAFVRVASWLLALEMVVAVVLFHARQGFFIVAIPNVPLAYGFEYHLALLGGLFCLALSGPGTWSLESWWGRRVESRQGSEASVADASSSRG